MPIYLTIAIIVAVFMLMGMQTILTKRQNPFWGVIIPALVVGTGVYFYFFKNIELNYKNVMVFAIPLVWCLLEYCQGRKRRIEETEEEIRKMKAKDI